MITDTLLPMSSDSFSEIDLKITLCCLFTFRLCLWYTATTPCCCMLQHVVSWLLRPDDFHKLIMLKINKCYNSGICLE